MMQVTSEHRQHYCCSSLLSHCYRHAHVKLQLVAKHGSTLVIRQDVLWHLLMSNRMCSSIRLCQMHAWAEQDLNQLVQTGFEKLKRPDGRCRWGQHVHSQGGAQLRVWLQLRKWLLLQPYPAAELI